MSQPIHAKLPAAGAPRVPDTLTRRRALVLAGLLAGTAGLTKVARPTQVLAAKGEPLDLEQLVPKRFGDWRIDTSVVPIQPSPDVLQKIDAIYDQTLARTYINSQGQRVMLSIAYGGDQTGRLRVHRPESCYSAQGFAVSKVREEMGSFGTHKIPVKRLVARLGERTEPITYWIRVGKEAVTGNIGQRFAQFKYGFNGEIPDGLIFRVSSIDRDNEHAFGVHDEFVIALLGVLDKPAIARLIGDSDSGA